MNIMKRRVVVTGLGTVNPVGNDVENSWKNICNGYNGISYITAFDASDYKIKFSAEVKEFEPENRLVKRDIKHMDRFTQLALYAAEEAIQNSGILESVDEVYKQSDIGVIISSGIGGLGTIEKEHYRGIRRSFEKIDPYFVPKVICNIAAARIAITHGFQGACYSPIAACAGGSYAIGEAFRMIRDGYEDAIVCGGAESAITEMGIGGFCSLGALTNTDDVDGASIPFDAKRSGFVMGEGAGILVLEELEHAKSRNAPIIVEIVGYGINCDAYHITSPMLDGRGAALCMEMALKDAKITASDIDYINAHGTSTQLNDSSETNAIKRVFGENAYNVSISSTKSMTGHLLGGSGGVEAVFSCLAIRDNFVPPTINLKDRDVSCDLDYTPNVGKNKNVDYVLSNSLGFGGHNASLIFKKYDSLFENKSDCKE